MKSLIEELKERGQLGTLVSDDDHFGGSFPPLSESEVEKTEAELAFALPQTIRRIYREVANGGFGPAYGLLGLTGGMLNEDGCDAMGQYQMYATPDPNDLHWQWPHGLLPVGHLGCAMYLCVDCTKPEGPVIWFEPNPHEDGTPWTESFIPFAESTEFWLSSWINGEDLFEKMMTEE